VTQDRDDDPLRLMDRLDQATAHHARPLTSADTAAGRAGQQAPPAPAGAVVPPSYRQTSVHLTDDLYRWARDTAIDATRAGAVKVTTSEIIRLAVRRLREDLAEPPALELAAELAEQAHGELYAYPGRAARRLPERRGE
jgi:hypothetical protein